MQLSVLSGSIATSAYCMLCVTTTVTYSVIERRGRRLWKNPLMLSVASRLLEPRLSLRYLAGKDREIVFLWRAPHFPTLVFSIYLYIYIYKTNIDGAASYRVERDIRRYLAVCISSRPASRWSSSLLTWKQQLIQLTANIQCPAWVTWGLSAFRQIYSHYWASHDNSVSHLKKCH